MIIKVYRQFLKSIAQNKDQLLKNNAKDFLRKIYRKDQYKQWAKTTSLITQYFQYHNQGVHIASLKLLLFFYNKTNINIHKLLYYSQQPCYKTYDIQSFQEYQSKKNEILQQQMFLNITKFKERQLQIQDVYNYFIDLKNYRNFSKNICFLEQQEILNIQNIIDNNPDLSLVYCQFFNRKHINLQQTALVRNKLQDLNNNMVLLEDDLKT